jgi:hypothetical protein
MKTEKKKGQKTYILELLNGDLRRITVPETWKLTFGPVVPFSGKGGSSDGRVCLRFYEGSKDNLRAVFTDVRAFRDADMEIRERRTEVKRQVVQKRDGGGMKNVEVEARVTEWVDPDEHGDDGDKDKAAPYLAELASSTEDNPGSLFSRIQTSPIR